MYQCPVAARKSEEAAGEEKQPLMLRLPRSLHASLRHVAIDRGASLNALITQVLEEWWAKQPERTRYDSDAEKKPPRR
jgi:predicted HicB family RNase H-like nuclease